VQSHFCNVTERPDTFNDKQSQIAERKTGNGRGPGNQSLTAAIASSSLKAMRSRATSMSSSYSPDGSALLKLA